MKKITRPWQAIFLAVFGGVNLTANILILFFLLVMKDWFSLWLSQFNPEFIVLSAIRPSIFLLLVVSIVFLFFVIHGLWLGHKWVPICLTLLHGFSLLLIGFQLFSDWQGIIPFGIILFLLALDIECWRHPFFDQYSKKKNI